MTEADTEGGLVDMDTPVKLMMSWNIVPGREEACLSFITTDLPAAMEEAGLELADAWFSAYGNWPQIRISFLSSDLSRLQAFLTSDTWRKLKRRLLSFTQGYQQKIIVARRSFQI